LIKLFDQKRNGRKDKKMKFEEILKLLREGKKVRRKDWGNKDYYIYSLDHEGKIECLERVGYIFSLLDFLADDWEEYKEEDNWNMEKCCFEEEMGYHIDICDVKKLKEKIFEDIRKEHKEDLGFGIWFNNFKEILDKRFGFNEVKK